MLLDPVYFNAYSHHGGRDSSCSFSNIPLMPLSGRGTKVMFNPPASLLHPTNGSAWDFTMAGLAGIGGTSVSSTMVRLPHEDERFDCEEQPSNKHNKSRRVHAAYLSEMKTAYAKGRLARHIIHTNDQGVITGL
jgi:hypothetical protein